MPVLRGGRWEFGDGENRREDISTAENQSGHRPLSDYKLPSWVQHPAFETKRSFVVEKSAYVGMAVGGSRNHEDWNVAHVAAFHDDLKLLSLATGKEKVTPNRWGLTPAHMCSFGVHTYGPSLCVLYQLILDEVVDVDARTSQGFAPWHLCQQVHSPQHLAIYEKVLYKGLKPEMFDAKQEAQLRLRGKFGRPEKPIQQGEPSTLLPVCILFPGQGSQKVGMLSELKDLPPVKAMLETANRVLGYDLLKLCLEGPEETLAQTKFCQPAMYVAGLAALEHFKLNSPEKVERCMAMAGLSLGEYTALTAAGVFDFETGLRLVQARGDAMEAEASRAGDSAQAMLSVAGLEIDIVEKFCEEFAEPTVVCQVANYLFPKGVTVAGHRTAIEQLKEKLVAAGALQVTILKVSGAFHTPLMEGARIAFARALQAIECKMQPPRCSVYMNVNAQPIGPHTPVSEIVALLGQQLVSPVQWENSIRRAIDDGCSEFVECGPNKQLKSMMKRINLPMHNCMASVQA